MSISFIRDNSNYWTVLIDFKVHQFNETHEKYSELVESIKREDPDSFVKLFDTTKILNSWGEGYFKVVEGVLKYKDYDVHKVLADRILEMVDQGFPYKFMLRFIERLYNNPSSRAVTELYTFLEHEFLPISPEGYFLAYKAVTKDFKDKYTLTVNNSVGAEPEMPRFLVDDNCDIGCSKGFHVGAHKYASGFRTGGDVIVICQVDPADVVSIPKDSNCEKLRCCKYKVVGLYEGPMEPAVVDRYSEEKMDTQNDDDDDEWGGNNYNCEDEECPYCSDWLENCCCDDEN